MVCRSEQRAAGLFSSMKQRFNQFLIRTSLLDIHAWNFPRVLRVALGLAVLVAAIAQRDWMPMMFGALFLYQGIYNTGCAGGSCSTPFQGESGERSAESELIEVESEEIKADS